MSDIVVYSPIKLNAVDKKSIASYMQRKHNINAKVQVKLDKSLIAGIKITYEDKELDLSLTGKLDRLSQHISQKEV